MKLTPKEKFLARVRQDAVGGCWMWTGHVNKNGYGCMHYAGKQCVAHRVSWMLFRGKIPRGKLVCHTCDVRDCVNPDHLFLGTPADNAHDMAEKGRSRRGEKHGSAKLTSDQVVRIKALLAEDRMYMTEIAREFGVSPSTILAIKKGRAWRDVAARNAAHI